MRVRALLGIALFLVLAAAGCGGSGSSGSGSDGDTYAPPGLPPPPAGVRYVQKSVVARGQGGAWSCPDTHWAPLLATSLQMRGLVNRDGSLIDHAQFDRLVYGTDPGEEPPCTPVTMDDVASKALPAGLKYVGGADVNVDCAWTTSPAAWNSGLEIDPGPYAVQTLSAGHPVLARERSGRWSLIVGVIWEQKISDDSYVKVDRIQLQGLDNSGLITEVVIRAQPDDTGSEPDVLLLKDGLSSFLY